MPTFKVSFLATPPLVCCLTLLWGAAAEADETCGTVSLSVSTASAERFEVDTVFTFEATLHNDTGKDLEVRTTFSGLFDGLSLEVKTTKGEALVMQSYTHHQSPFAPPGRVFTLKQGKTTATIAFPVRDFPADVREVEVLLSGHLPGHGERYKLATKPLSLKIK
jgi:hypothetical protein